MGNRKSLRDQLVELQSELASRDRRIEAVLEHLEEEKGRNEALRRRLSDARRDHLRMWVVLARSNFRRVITTGLGELETRELAADLLNLFPKEFVAGESRDA